MCGILVSNLINKKEVKKVLTALKHRGPDSTRILSIDDKILMGFVRLAINGTTNKEMQPFNLRNKLYGVFNGEIYNYQRLSHFLKIDLTSKSDMEIILYCYEKLGSKFYLKLDGMFSGVILDLSKNKLLVIRDILGQKPMFLVKTNANFFITSELKSLKMKDIKSVNALKCGLTLLDLEGNIVEEKYLDLKYNLSTTKNLSLNSLLKKAVLKRIPNQGKFGVLLSGGIDSSIIASIIENSTYKENVIYYSIIKDDSEDYPYIKMVHNFFNIAKKNICLINLSDIDGAQIEKVIKKVVWSTESYNPSIVSNAIGVYLISEKAKNQGIRVVLSGEGADELFCGYKIFQKKKVTVQNWKEIRKNLMNTLHFTELRRSDLASMAHSIELRSPFLDKEIVYYSNTLQKQDFFNEGLNKYILRKNFVNDLPKGIVNRSKLSFDKGAGVRSILFQLLSYNETQYKTEKKFLKEIWKEFYDEFYGEFENLSYFHSHPCFDEFINKRKLNYNTQVDLKSIS